jgi:predicted CopG family antitoxin
MEGEMSNERKYNNELKHAILEEDVADINQMKSGYNSSEWLNQLSERSRNGLTFLHIAVEKNSPQAIDALLNGLKPEQKAKAAMIEDINEETVYESAIEGYGINGSRELQNSLLFGASFIGSKPNDNELVLDDLDDECKRSIEQSGVCITKPSQLADLFRMQSTQSEDFIQHFENNKSDYKELAKNVVSNPENLKNSNKKDMRLLEAASCKNIINKLHNRETTGRSI